MATAKQRRATELLMENRGNVSKSMREAGYDDTTAKNPKNLTESKGFAELRDEYLPKELVLQAHKDALTAMRIHGTNDNFIEIADHPVRLKASELYYKMTGQLIDKAQIDGTLEVTIKRE